MSMISPNTCTAVKEALLHVLGARLFPLSSLDPGARLQSSSTLVSSHWRALCLFFESVDQTLASKSCSETLLVLATSLPFRVGLRSLDPSRPMSGQKPSKLGFLKAPFKSFKGRLTRDSSPSGTQSTFPPRLSPQPDSVALSIPSAGSNSAAASNVSVVPVSESWWSNNCEEIVASVRQVLNIAKEALDGVPVPGLKAAVGGLSESLKLFQVSDVYLKVLKLHGINAAPRPSGETIRVWWNSREKSSVSSPSSVRTCLHTRTPLRIW
jgi:hypothetical protein